MPTTPKKLERSRSDKVLGGVCGGVADYLNMDPTLVRVLTAVLTLVTGGVPIMVYLVMLFVVPEGAGTPTRYPSVPPGPAAGFGGYDSTRRDDTIWGTEGAPWEQRPTTPPAPSASFRAAPTPPVSAPPGWAQPVSSQPVPTEPVPSDPPPVEPYDPQPVGPSDPEAPVVAPSDPGPDQPTVPTHEGRPRPI